MHAVILTISMASADQGSGIARYLHIDNRSVRSRRFRAVYAKQIQLCIVCSGVRGAALARHGQLSYEAQDSLVDQLGLR